MDIADTLPARRQELESRIKTGSGWLWSVVGFSIANTLLMRLGVDLGFCIGLVATQLADYMSLQQPHAGTTIATLGFDALLFGGFAFVARACARGQRWLLLAGLVLYALDAALAGFAQLWPSLFFHALTLGYGSRAFLAIGESRKPASAEAQVARPGFTGLPAIIVGLVVLGVVLTFVIYVCQEADQFVANR